MRMMGLGPSEVIVPITSLRDISLKSNSMAGHLMNGRKIGLGSPLGASAVLPTRTRQVMRKEEIW